MKSVLLVFALTSAAIATGPDCDSWTSRINTLEVTIFLEKDKLELCKDNCRDMEEALNSMIREKELTQEFLDDPTHGCSSGELARK